MNSRNYSLIIIRVSSIIIGYFLFYLSFFHILGLDWESHRRIYPLSPHAFLLKIHTFYESLESDVRVDYIYLVLKGITAGITTFLGIYILPNLFSAGKSELFGNSHFAAKSEIKKAGYFCKKGVIIGKYKNRHLMTDTPGHLLAFAPTRSGKGVGLVIPNLLNWPYSVIVNDIKSENFTLTAGFRARHQRVIYFNPADLSSTCYNPLYAIRKGIFEVADAQLIANNLIDNDDNREDYWIREARALLVGLILYVIHDDDLEHTIGQVRRLLHNPDESVEDLLTRLQRFPHTTVSQASAGILQKAEKDRSGVISTVKSFLQLWADPLVDEVTRRSEFSFADFERERISLYLCTPPEHMSRVARLQKLIWAQGIQFLMQRENKNEQVLLLLDEFPSLGRIDDFEDQIAYVAGYGIRLFLICQDLRQIEAIYKKADSIINNCKIRITFATNDDRTASRISKWSGITTVSPSNMGKSGSIISLFLSRRSESRGEAPRQLLNPGEIMQLNKDISLLFQEGHMPVMADKIRYYEVSYWNKLTDMKPPVKREIKLKPIELIQETRTVLEVAEGV